MEQGIEQKKTEKKTDERIVPETLRKKLDEVRKLCEDGAKITDILKAVGIVIGETARLVLDTGPVTWLGRRIAIFETQHVLIEATVNCRLASVKIEIKDRDKFATIEDVAIM